MFSSDPVVQLSDVSLRQGDQTVLEEVSFNIDKGEFVFLVGRTGSGKSSLMKALYADIPLYSGEGQVAGFDVRNLRRKEVPLLRRKRGIVCQDFQLFPDRTLEDNLLFVMRATGWSDRLKMKTRMTETLIKVGLGSAEKRMPHQLSGGEQQRVAIARALLNEPLILLADEPTGNLDPEVADGIVELFRQINNSGSAILMATHSYDLVRKYPARVLRCDDRRIAEVTNFGSEPQPQHG